MACFPKISWHWLVWVACLPLFAAVGSETRLARAFLLGYLCGAIFFSGSCYWFVAVTERYGGLSPPLAWGVLTLFALVSAVFFGAFGLVEGWMARVSASAALGIAPFLWVALEVARTYLIAQFPWNLLGYAVRAEGLRQVASVTGVYGLSFLAASSSALLAGSFVARRRKWAGTALLAWVALLWVGNRVLAPPAVSRGEDAAYLVQTNIPLDESALESWVPWRDPTGLNQLVKISLAAIAAESNPAKAAPPLIVWAENPAPFYFTRDPVFRNAAEGLARQARAYLVFNTVIPIGEDINRVTNSAVVLDPDGREVLQYDKIHLVPFGEYVPAWAFPNKVGKITSEVGNYVPGSSYRIAWTPQGAVGVFICYEAIFPQLARGLVLAGAEVLVNVSNDAWYGDTAAAFQHLEMARIRAIENGRYLLRATNDGITVVVDPYGRVVDQIPRHCQMVLRGRFNYRRERTLYTSHGDVFAWLCVAASVGVLIGAAVKREGKRA